MNNEIKFLANVKQVNVKNLASMDKEVRVVLSVVGKDIDQAILLSNLSIEKQVEVKAEL